MTIGITSMYANPIHPGHIECLELSKNYCDALWVIVNNDLQSQLKRGVPSFQSEDFRKRIVESIRWVDKAYIAEDEDGTVCQTLKGLYQIARLNFPYCDIIFTKGGDKFASNIPEKKICDRLGIKIIDGLGEKIYNSSEMIKQ
jgi:cytidyltransferase-like protein